MENQGYYARVWERFPARKKKPDPRLLQKDCHLVVDRLGVQGDYEMLAPYTKRGRPREEQKHE